MARPLLKELLVVIPHSGIVIPAEIPLESLSERFPEMVRNVDWYTNWLYDFRDFLDNQIDLMNFQDSDMDETPSFAQFLRPRWTGFVNRFKFYSSKYFKYSCG